MKSAITVFFVFTTLSTLAFGTDLENAKNVESETSVSYDQFKKTTEYNSPTIQIMQPGNYYWHEIILRAFKKGGGAPSDFQIYVDTHYTDSRYISYNKAYDNKGEKLSLSKIDHAVVSCDGAGQCVFEEVFAIKVSKAYLESREKFKEIKFKIEGTSNYLTFEIDGTYIKGFLNAVKNKKPSDETS